MTFLRLGTGEICADLNLKYNNLNQCGSGSGFLFNFQVEWKVWPAFFLKFTGSGKVQVKPEIKSSGLGSGSGHVQIEQFGVQVEAEFQKLGSSQPEIRQVNLNLSEL